MSRPKFALFCGLLMVSVAADLAQGQAPPRRPTFTERISAFGRGLTGYSPESEQQATPAAAATEQPATRAAFPQVDGRSLLPNSAFGRNPQQQQNPQRTNAERTGTAPRTAAQSNSSQAPSTRGGRLPANMGSTVETTERYAARPRAGSAGESGDSRPAGTSLPGLGGSPLPSSAAGDDVATPGNESEPSSSSAPAPPSDNFRAATSPTPRVSPKATPAASPTTRQSPRAHAPIHVDPSELRQELAGSFPAGDENPKPAKQPAQELPVQSPTSEPTFNVTPAPEPFTRSSTSRSDFDSQSQPSTVDAVNTLPVSEGSDAKAAPTTPFEEIVPMPRGTASAREEFNSNPAPAFEPIPRSSSKTGFAPTTTPIPATQSNIPTQPVAPQSPAARAPIGATSRSALNEPNVLVANRTPIITSDIRGPKQILVGREATFRVRLQNQGDAAAEGVDIALRVPSWAEVIDTAASNGTVSQTPTTESASVLRWQISRLEPRGSETIDLRLVPRSSRPLELGVTWTLAPVGSRAVVEVQEPKLEMNVAGPDEVLFGKPQLFRFTLSNPGSGIAENVRIELYPPGGGEKPAASNPLADLPPGKSQTIEVELVAREAGKLKIRAVASGAGDLTSESVKEVFCRKPELAVDWRGPEMKYAGTEATYFIRVRNPGTAPADDVTVRAILPEGAQLTSASDGKTFDAAKREIAWRVGSLGPGDDSYMELKCTVNTPGNNQLRFEAATASGELSDKKVAETKVVALGDLKLDVTDPSGPVAIGDSAVYEIRVQNRGASSAKDIQIVGLFSAGVEPDQADGSQYTVSNGRVSFRSIEDLPAGRQVTLKIRAHAVQPGTHIFRAEVLCRDLEIKLAAEETTRFYADDSRDSAERQASGGGSAFPSTR